MAALLQGSPYWPGGGLGSDAVHLLSIELRTRGRHRFMRLILIAAGFALAVALLLTPVLIRVFTRWGSARRYATTPQTATNASGARRRWVASRSSPRSGQAT